MSQQHNTTFKWQNSCIQALPQNSILFQHTQKDRHHFWNFREKNMLEVICTCVTILLHPVPLKICKSRKSKENLHHFFMKSFPPKAETSSYFFVCCQLAWEAYYPRVTHTFPKGRENWVHSPSRKESFKCMRHIRYKNHFLLVPLSVSLPASPQQPHFILVSFWENNCLKSVGVIPVPKLNLCLTTLSEVSPLLMSWARQLLTLHTELLWQKEKQRRNQCTLPLRFQT